MTTPQTNNSLPIIGISMDHGEKGGYALYPWYALRQNYCDAIRHAGGVALLLPFDDQAIDVYLDRIDGLMVPGGDLDVHPRLYGETPRSSFLRFNEKRSLFDANLVQRALQRKMPFLGICMGMQTLNVVMGGSLYQHIPDDHPNAMDHEQKNAKHETSHDITIALDSMLLTLNENQPTARVNSTHHQAIKNVAEKLKVTGHAPDGIIEAVEMVDDDYPFCMGVQWHPEYESTALDRSVFQAFVKACALRQGQAAPHSGAASMAMGQI